MSILTKQEKSALIEQAKEYDYIRFSWTDLNGISRGKTVISRYAKRFIRQGLGIHSGKLNIMFKLLIVSSILYVSLCIKYSLKINCIYTFLYLIHIYN